jgi:hypothetical protein
MTAEEIFEYNKRCAEFLGWKQIKDLENIVEENEHLKDCWYLPYTELVFWNTDVLKFSTDWNWIHNIIEAIEKLKYLVVVQSNFCQIQEIGTKENNFKPLIIASLYGNSKTESVVESINQFLIWYNEKNKENDTRRV